MTGEIAFGSSKLSNTAPDPDQVSDGSVSQFSFAARAYHEMAGFDWGILGAYSHAGSDFDSLVAGQAQPQEADESINMWMVGIGPVWNDEPQDWQIAGHVTFESQSREFNPPGDRNNTDQRFFTFPGFRIAAERRLWRTIWIRGGVRSDYFFGSTETETQAATTEVFDREYRFRWTAGFSTEVSRFRFEGAFNEPWLTTGPQFLADSSDFLAIATATYFWGSTK